MSPSKSSQSKQAASSLHESLADDLLCINCGGRDFWTRYSTLAKLPGTPLSQIARQRERHHTYQPQLKCYFFDRSPEAFASVLDYYRTDELHISDIVCGNAMRNELKFWGLNEAEIEPCCWGNYAKFHSHKETLTALESTFGGGDEVVLEESKELLTSKSRWRRFQSRVWIALEYPSENVTAKIFMIISMIVVVASILETIFESHYYFRVIHHPPSGTGWEPAPNPADYKPPDTRCGYANPTTNQTLEDYPITEPHPYLAVLDDICVAYFLLELIVRFIFAPFKKQFCKSPLNIIDFICIVPQIISTIIKHTHFDGGAVEAQSRSYSKAGDILKAITVLRTVRVLRVFKLMKHYSAFKILAYTVKISTKELLLMVVYLMTLVLIFASVIHYAEQDNFDSIPIGLWWALVTMTTVGYGDKYPKQVLGYIVGSVCVICGVLVIALTVPIVVNNFTLYYTHAKTRTKLPKDVVLDLRKKGSSRRVKSLRTDSFEMMEEEPNSNNNTLTNGHLHTPATSQTTVNHPPNPVSNQKASLYRPTTTPTSNQTTPACCTGKDNDAFL